MKTYSSNDIIKLLTNEGYEISKRTFTYYASDKKILPEPVIHNGRPRYTELHIKYLRAILILKQKGDTLKEIKTSLDALNELELDLIAETYKPFTSKEMIKDIQSSYSSLTTNDTINSYSESLNSDSIYHNQLITNSVYSSKSNTVVSSSGTGFSSSNTNSKSSKRTIVNEDIILETKNIDSETLQKIIQEIEKTYNYWRNHNEN